MKTEDEEAVVGPRRAFNTRTMLALKAKYQVSFVTQLKDTEENNVPSITPPTFLGQGWGQGWGGDGALPGMFSHLEDVCVDECADEPRSRM